MKTRGAILLMVSRCGQRAGWGFEQVPHMTCAHGLHSHLRKDETSLARACVKATY